MTSGARTRSVIVVAASLLLAWSAIAHADQAYDKVAAQWAQGGGQLNPCAFTQAELEAAIGGIPPNIRDVVPDLRRAMEDGVAAHERGDCRGIDPADAAAAPAATTPPVATTPTTETAPATPPPATTTVPPATTAPEAAQPPAAAGERDDDRTPLLVALVAAGALVLLLLALWAWARMRGWDPVWVARTRHAWGEAGHRTTSTWSEFTDWLRLGR
jgi:hypothetical protein